MTAVVVWSPSTGLKRSSTAAPLFFTWLATSSRQSRARTELNQAGGLGNLPRSSVECGLHASHQLNPVAATILLARCRGCTVCRRSPARSHPHPHHTHSHTHAHSRDVIMVPLCLGLLRVVKEISPSNQQSPRGKVNVAQAATWPCHEPPTASKTTYGRPRNGQDLQRGKKWRLPFELDRQAAGHRIVRSPLREVCSQLQDAGPRYLGRIVQQLQKALPAGADAGPPAATMLDSSADEPEPCDFISCFPCISVQ